MQTLYPIEMNEVIQESVITMVFLLTYPLICGSTIRELRHKWTQINSRINTYDVSMILFYSFYFVNYKVFCTLLIFSFLTWNILCCLCLIVPNTYSGPRWQSLNTHVHQLSAQKLHELNHPYSSNLVCLLLTTFRSELKKCL